MSVARSAYGRRRTFGPFLAERLIFTAALARSTADSSPAVYSASSTPPLNPVCIRPPPAPDLYGIGPLVAARFIAEVVDVRRYPDRNAFAAANGTAPLPASSGRTVRHRFNPGGNRQLNRALYTIAITQIRSDTEGRAYYERKRAAGKTKREALRCLKRKLSDIVFTTMRHDADRQTPQLGQLPPPNQARVGAADANEARLTA